MMITFRKKHYTLARGGIRAAATAVSTSLHLCVGSFLDAMAAIGRPARGAF